MSLPVDPTLATTLENASPAEQAEAILDYVLRRGNKFYDESVTQLEHGLQCAHLAREENRSTSLIVAALLHDIGHLLLDESEAVHNFLSEDLFHETLGADYLANFFEESVLQPIRLHVPAKRYLCSTDPTYHDRLSEASKQSFQLQGGQMTQAEMTEMQRNSHLEDALALRRWDDLAKVPGRKVPPMESYRDELIAALSSAQSHSAD